MQGKLIKHFFLIFPVINQIKMLLLFSLITFSNKKVRLEEILNTNTQYF